MPEPDAELSPLTGWSRPHWTALADRLLTASRKWASPAHAQIVPPGAEGGYGRAVDGLEGFARTFLLAGFRLAGDQTDPLGLAEWYSAGLAAGCDPAGAERWITPVEHPQAKVEAASLALILDLTREQIWANLPDRTRGQLIDYLSQVVGDTTYPRNNWLWFRIVVETFLRSVGGPWSAEDIEEDLALHDSFVRQDGWLADGSGRDFDHYVGWALHLYPELWQRMRGGAELATDERRRRDRAMLDRYLLDAAHLVGADGGPLIQGRSLIYRFAPAAPFWVGALAEVPSTPPGLLRRAASGMVSHFAARGVPDEHGLLSLGWHHPWRPLAQSYSGPGSPYWAAKAFLGLALEPAHPVWTAVEEPLPVERGDFTRAIAAPGWLVHARAADGIAQVANHGTDHARPADQVGDSPLYARLGYSTATAPLLNESAWVRPLDQAACLIDADGRASHRAGMEVLALSTGGDPAVGLAVSSGTAHWLVPDPTQQRHGSGFEGEAEDAGSITVVSLVRSAWEVRGVRWEAPKVDQPHPQAVAIRVGGWAVAGEGTGGTELLAGGTASANATGGGLTSWVAELAPTGQQPGANPAVAVEANASPLGEPSRVPYLDFPATPGLWRWALIGLTRGLEVGGAANLMVDDAVTVTWPDGTVTTTPLDTTCDSPGKACVVAGPPGVATDYPYERINRNS
ncbi:MAG: DUF2264 domain-containing protein [Bifidobacteriaceae bacterium]|nr:DUF2264 domain-containing protein [Bifidobacteriaceae bacterium]